MDSIKHVSCTARQTNTVLTQKYIYMSRVESRRGVVKIHPLNAQILHNIVTVFHYKGHLTLYCKIVHE